MCTFQSRKQMVLHNELRDVGDFFLLESYLYPVVPTCQKVDKIGNGCNVYDPLRARYVIYRILKIKYDKYNKSECTDVIVYVKKIAIEYRGRGTQTIWPQCFGGKST